MESPNYYENKANRQFLNETNEPAKPKSDQEEEKPEKWKDAAKAVGTDLAVGVFGGGLAAAAIGKPAFLVGLVISGYGHYTKNKTLSALGMGMMASGTMSALNSKAQALTLPERIKEFQEELKRKLFLDKLFPVNTSDSINGIEKTPEKPIVTVQKPMPSDFLSSEEIENKAPTDLKENEINGAKETKSNLFNEDSFDDWRTNGRIY